MTVFIGNAANNTANATGAGTLIGFAGGNIALLQDALADTFVGFGGNDVVVAGNGNDAILGGDGNDFIDGRFGFDLMDGGNGIDTMDVSFFGGAYVWNMATGVTNFSASGEFAFNFENARMGAGADSITGNAAANSISTGAGNDRAFGGDGNDRLSGETGNDILAGGNGNDVASGGDGNDRLSGDAGNDSLFGGNGIDSVSGGDGDDRLSGDAGNDNLSGGNGFDSLSGGADNDFVNGGLGNDVLSGGVGFDQFVFNTAPNSLANFDRITDFSSAFDTIRLENAVYAALPAGALARRLSALALSRSMPRTGSFTTRPPATSSMTRMASPVPPKSASRK